MRKPVSAAGVRVETQIERLLNMSPDRHPSGTIFFSLCDICGFVDAGLPL
jgi:hypothetical protein